MRYHITAAVKAAKRIRKRKYLARWGLINASTAGKKKSEKEGGKERFTLLYSRALSRVSSTSANPPAHGTYTVLFQGAASWRLRNVNSEEGKSSGRCRHIN
jgi:hypothetical protein